jgi:small subunit ribosomal protein S17
MDNRGLRKERTGVIVSDRMQKTVVVTVERAVTHPKYKKILRRRTNVKAHDETNQCRIGDRVLIVECRPSAEINGGASARYWKERKRWKRRPKRRVLSCGAEVDL